MMISFDKFLRFIFTVAIFQTSQVFSVSHVDRTYREYSLNNPNTFSEVTPIGQPPDSDIRANVKLADFDVNSIVTQSDSDVPSVGHLSYSDVASIGQLSNSDDHPMLYKVKPTFLEDGDASPQQDFAELFLNPYSEDRRGRHFTTFDACANSMCDQVLRQAHSLGRIKLLREYIKDTVSMLDRLVTSVDSQLVTAGETLSRAVGSRCRAVQSVLKDITSVDSRQTETRKSNIKDSFPVK